MIYCDLKQIPIFRDKFLQLEPGIYSCKSFSDLPSWVGPTAYRIWREDDVDGFVEWVKQPGDVFGAKIDMKEFMWLKLSAKQFTCST